MQLSRRRKSLITFAICLTALLFGGGQCPLFLIEFTGTGVLVQGTECVLYRDDDAGVYILDNYGDFEIGDRVRVHGWIDQACVSICQEGNGCLKYNTIEASGDVT